MPHGPSRPMRGRRVSRAGGLLAASAWLAWLACSAPDGSGLFQPYPTGGASGASGNAGNAGAGGSGSDVFDADADGQGGGTPLMGVAGTHVAVAAFEDAGAGVAAELDAGSAPDAARPPPVTCIAPSAEVCDGIDNDCDDRIDPGSTCPDACTGFALAGRGYMFCSDAVDRTVALTSCEAEGLKLVWIETSAENEGLVASVTALDGVVEGELLTQIGASDEDDEDEWIWVESAGALDGFQFWEGNGSEGSGGEPVDGAYQSWAEGEPNDQDGEEDCGVLSVSGSQNREPGQWDDRRCDDELPFLCEVP